ncbi:MAG: diguanylate cyclase [Nitrospirales bacterium]
MKNLHHVQQAVEASLREFTVQSQAPLSSQEQELSQSLQALSDRLKHILSAPNSLTPSEFLKKREEVRERVVQPFDRPQPLGDSSSFCVSTSPEGTILSACDKACEVLGFNVDGLGSISLSDILPHEEWKVIHQVLREAEAMPAPYEGVMTLKTGSGRNQMFRGIATPMFDQQHHVSNWIWNLVVGKVDGPRISQATLTSGLAAQMITGESLEFCLSQICRGLVSALEVSFTWIGVCQEEHAPLALCAHAEAVELNWLDFGPTWWRSFSESQPLINLKSGIEFLHCSKGEGKNEEVTWVPLAYGPMDCVVMPLTHGGMTCGVFVVASRGSSTFDERLCRWLQSLRAQILDLLDCGKRLTDMRLRSDEVLDPVSYAVCVMDVKGCLQWVNEAYAKLNGQSVSRILGTPFRTFPREQLQALERSPEGAKGMPGYVKTDIQEKQANGVWVDLEQVVTPVVNQQGTITHYVAILQDITGRKTLEAKIKHLAYHDPLTDLPNRVMFEDRLHQALAYTRRQGGLLAVLFLDLDNFKPVNDQYGHGIGDRLLRIVAKRLVTCVRSTDTVARLCGDEFTIILQGLDRIRDIRQVAQKVLDCLAPPIRLNGHVISVKTSIGISVYPNDATHPNQLLEIADQAMYQAKEQGGQQWVFATPEWNAE